MEHVIQGVEDLNVRRPLWPGKKVPRWVVRRFGLQSMLHLRTGSDPVILHKGEPWKELDRVENGLRIREDVVGRLLLRLQGSLQLLLMAILRFLPGALVALTKKESSPVAGAFASVIPHQRGWVPEVLLKEHVF